MPRHAAGIEPGASTGSVRTAAKAAFVRKRDAGHDARQEAAFTFPHAIVMQSNCFGWFSVGLNVRRFDTD